MKRVGIVILNWLRPRDVVACLDSLALLDYPAYEVVVVDNSTSGELRTLLGDRLARISLIASGRNVGFAAGCNIGIEFLLGKGSDYVLLLNDDTEVSPDLLRVLVEQAERDPRIGLIGPKIHYYDRRNVIWSAGGAVDRLGQPRHLRVGEVDVGADEDAVDVDYVSGCAILARREFIERVGVLDARFFAYFEEAEWCARAHRAGYRVVYAPQTQMWHKISMQARATSPGYLYLMTRNRLLYLHLTGAGTRAMLLAVVELLRTVVTWTVRPRHKAMRPYSAVLVHGILDFARGRFGAPPAQLQ